MTFTIPVWVLVTLAILVGVPALLFILLLAALGWMVLRTFKGGIWR